MECGESRQGNPEYLDEEIRRGRVTTWARAGEWDVLEGKKMGGIGKAKTPKRGKGTRRKTAEENNNKRTEGRRTKKKKDHSRKKERKQKDQW